MGNGIVVVVVVGIGRVVMQRPDCGGSNPLFQLFHVHLNLVFHFVAPFLFLVSPTSETTTHRPVDTLPPVPSFPGLFVLFSGGLLFPGLPSLPGAIRSSNSSTWSSTLISRLSFILFHLLSLFKAAAGQASASRGQWSSRALDLSSRVFHLLQTFSRPNAAEEHPAGWCAPFQAVSLQADSASSRRTPERLAERLARPGGDLTGSVAGWPGSDAAGACQT